MSRELGPGDPFLLVDASMSEVTEALRAGLSPEQFEQLVVTPVADPEAEALGGHRAAQELFVMAIGTTAGAIGAGTIHDLAKAVATIVCKRFGYDCEQTYRDVLDRLGRPRTGEVGPDILGSATEDDSSPEGA